MSETAETFIEKAREIPVMPPVAGEIIRRSENPDTEVSELTELISKDPALALRVLKIANSSFYSSARKIETLQQAIVLLGFSTLRSIVVAASLKDVFSRFGLAERLLWEHSIAAAIASTTVARHVGGLSRDEAFLGGLLHDTGKLLMHFQAEKQYQEVMKVVYAGEAEPIEAERDIFGFDHAEVGGLVLEKWRLSPRLVAAFANHHDPEHASDENGIKALAALIQLGDQLCLQEGLGRRKPNPDLRPLECAGAKLLGLEGADAEELLEPFRAAYDAEKDVFS